MCIIIVKPKNKELPFKRVFKNSYQRNNDGIGVALQKESNKLIEIKKDFYGVTGLWDWLRKNVEPADTLIVHFRLATSGLVDHGNNHPYPITHNKELLRKPVLKCQNVVAHNGVLSDYSGHKKFSDTQKFIVDILASIKQRLGSKTVQKMITSYIGFDKLAIITQEAGLIMLGKFIEDDGIFYSNTAYKREVTVTTYDPKDFSNHAYNRRQWWEKNRCKGDKTNFITKCGFCNVWEAAEYNALWDLYLCATCQDGLDEAEKHYENTDNNN